MEPLIIECFSADWANPFPKTTTHLDTMVELAMQNALIGNQFARISSSKHVIHTFLF